MGYRADHPSVEGWKYYRTPVIRVELYIDERYRTGLGTSFYNRVRELRELEKLLAAYRLIVVYGPRNVGKSELVRYFLKRMGAGSLLVDSRRLRAAEALGSDTVEYMGGLQELVEDAASVLASVSREAGLLSLVVGLAYKLWSVLRRIGRTILFIDEFHELPRYAGGQYSLALEDLRSLAALLAKGDEKLQHIQVIVAVSEGFALSPRALSLLEGYSAAWMLVEPMDVAHFTRLYREYSGGRRCLLPLSELLALAGPLPGYLAELCGMDRGQLIGRIERWQQLLENALAALGRKLGASNPQQAIRIAYEILDRPIKPLANPQAYHAGEILAEHDIVYPKSVTGAIIFKPQLNIYRILLRLAAAKRVESILDINPTEAYQEALKDTQEKSYGEDET